MKVIKRDGRIEDFDKKKVYNAAYRSCMNAHLDKGYSDKIAKEVVRDVLSVVRGKKKIKSNDLFQETVKIIKKYNYDAAFLYATHRDVS